jgi:hypothetical protein
VKPLKALAAAALVALGAASPAAAAQILLNPSQIIGSLGNWSTHPSQLVDQQTGPVTGDSAWTAGYGWTISFDLGEAMELGRLDLFSQRNSTFSFTAGNQVAYNGWGSYFLVGNTSTAVTGDLAADTGDTLTAQSFRFNDATKYRYIQLHLAPQQGVQDYSLNEFRLFDREVSAVPEPGTWALMITGVAVRGAYPWPEPRTGDARELRGHTAGLSFCFPGLNFASADKDRPAPRLVSRLPVIFVGVFDARAAG